MDENTTDNRLQTLVPRKQRPKSAWVCFCRECGEDIFIVVHDESGTMYCRCLECGMLFPNAELAVRYFLNDPPVWEMDPLMESEAVSRLYDYIDHDRFATRQEVVSAGWDIPQNRVSVCGECFMFHNRRGFVRIKKATKTGRLFCRCDVCKSIWLDIRDPLTLIPMEYVKKYGSRTVRPDEIVIEEEEEVSREEIVSAGWDVYDDVMLLERLPNQFVD